MNLLISPEYNFTCLWAVEDDDIMVPLEISSLPIDEDLKKAMTNWFSDYQETFNSEYPGDSGFPSKIDEINWIRRGAQLFDSLKLALGNNNKIRITSIITGKSYEHSSDFLLEIVE